MVLFSPYKSSRFVAPGAFKSLSDRSRIFAEWFTGRPWAHGYVIYNTDARAPLAMTIIWYGMQRVMHARLEEDEYDRTIINRWGGSVDAVRKNLSPEDYVRARTFIQYENYHGFFLPQELLHKPAGLDLPGPAESHH